MHQQKKNLRQVLRKHLTLFYKIEDPDAPDLCIYVLTQTIATPSTRSNHCCPPLPNAHSNSSPSSAHLAHHRLPQRILPITVFLSICLIASPSPTLLPFQSRFRHNQSESLGATALKFTATAIMRFVTEFSHSLYNGLN